MQGPQQKAFEKKADGQRKLGGANKRLSKRKPTDNASWGGAPAKRLSKRKPTDNASWGGAPAKGFRKESRRITQAGVDPTK